MNDKCLTLGELKSVRSLPRSDSRRKHLENCPRCRSRHLSFRDFIEPEAPATGSKPKEAAAHLAAFVDREILGRSSELTKPERDAGRDPEGFGSRLLRWFWHPAMRPVWAVGILVLAFIGIQEVRHTTADQDDRIVLRQSPDTPVETLKINDPELLTDGTLRLSWEPVDGADSYQVSFLGVEFEEMKRFDAGSEVSLPLSSEFLAELRDRGEPVLWEVIALKGGDQILASGAYPFDDPR